MRLGKAEYQNLFERGRTAKKTSKLAEGLPIFLGGVEMLAALTLELAFAFPARTGERNCQNTPPSPAGRPGRLREVKREKRPVRTRGERAHPASDDTDVAAQACPVGRSLKGGRGPERSRPGLAARRRLKETQNLLYLFAPSTSPVRRTAAWLLSTSPSPPRYRRVANPGAGCIHSRPSPASRRRWMLHRSRQTNRGS